MPWIWGEGWGGGTYQTSQRLKSPSSLDVVTNPHRDESTKSPWLRDHPSRQTQPSGRVVILNISRFGRPSGRQKYRISNGREKLDHPASGTSFSPHTNPRSRGRSARRNDMFQMRTSLFGMLCKDWVGQGQIHGEFETY